MKKVVTAINYQNETTGEVTENHKQAVEWYREGHDIMLISWSDVCHDWIERLEWVH